MKTNSNSKPKGRGRKFNGSKPKQNDKFEEGKLSSKGRDNDPNWYFTSPELAQQASELSFQNMLGAGPVISNYSVPSILTFFMNPCPGITYQAPNAAATLPSDAALQDGSTTNLTSADVAYGKDGINLMSTKIYTLLSTYSGRTSNYGPEDVALMNLAISEVASMLEHIRRAFGVALTYNPRNRMLPLGILRAMNIDGQDLIHNLANYRMRYNVLIARINQIPILDNIGYIRKSRDMYQRVYVDDMSSMAQMYLYVPYTTWTLEEQPNQWTLGSVLRTTQVITPGTERTVADLLQIVETQVDALLFSSTLNIVYSDIINLANKTNVAFTRFDYLAENYVVMPEFNRNANLQMHNLNVYKAPSDFHPAPTYSIPWWDDKCPRVAGQSAGNGYMMITPSNDVWANSTDACVVYNPVFRVLYSEMSDDSWYSGPNIVDMDVDSPSLEDRIEALRFKCISSGFFRPHGQFSPGVSNDHFFTWLPTLPDHYCVGGQIFTNQTDTPVDIGQSVQRNLNLFEVFAFSQLKSHPLIYKRITSGSYASNICTGIVGDLTFWTTIDYSYLMRLNRLISTGLFDFS